MSTRSLQTEGLWHQGWYLPATKLASPNFGPRPQNACIDLVVIHSISLPPGQYGGNEVQDLFTNQHTPTSSKSGTYRFHRIFISVATACSGNLSAPTTVPGMPVFLATEDAINAIMTRLASNLKAWKVTVSKMPNTHSLPICAGICVASIRLPMSRVMNTLPPVESKIPGRDLIGVG